MSSRSRTQTLRRSFGLGFPLQDLAIAQVYATFHYLHGSLLPKLLHRPGHRLPVGAYHGAQLLVGVGGVQPDPLPADDALAGAEPEYEAGKARTHLLVGQLRKAYLSSSKALALHPYYRQGHRGVSLD